MKLWINPKTQFKFFVEGGLLMEPEDMQAIGQAAADQIKARVQNEGGNIHDAAMPRYSKSYRNIRAKEGLQTGHRDLTRTGRMWRGWAVWGATTINVRIGFRSGYSQTVARYNNDRERFIGMSPRDWQDVAPLIQKIVDKRTDKIRFIKRGGR